MVGSTRRSRKQGNYTNHRIPVQNRTKETRSYLSLPELREVVLRRQETLEEATVSEAGNEHMSPAYDDDADIGERSDGDKNDTPNGAPSEDEEIGGMSDGERNEMAEERTVSEKDTQNGPLEMSDEVDEEARKDYFDEDVETEKDKENSEEEEVVYKIQAIPPEKMFFEPCDYNISIKLSGRCNVSKAVRTLKGLLNESELMWFTKHPQFNHFFHMYLEDNHKSMGMWMLLLRMVSSRKEKECWFVVNGVPIRYSLREFGLISGLNCRRYPDKFKSGRLGGDTDKFVKMHFGKNKKKVTLEDVGKKLESMRGKAGKGRLNIAVLYFLASVIVGKEKTGDSAPGVEPFFLKAASDLRLCETFPWGRFAYDQNIKDIRKLVVKFEGKVSEKANKVIPSFFLPMEFLAFEAIPILGSHFREPVAGASSRCPRMCKTKFKKGDMKGFALSEINKELGGTKDIYSVLQPYNDDEEQMLAEIMYDANLEEDAEDLVIDGWNRILVEEKRDIFFKDMYKQDVDNSGKPFVRKEERDENMASTSKNDREVLLEKFKELQITVENGFKVMNKKLRDHDQRIKKIEKMQKKDKAGKKKQDDEMAECDEENEEEENEEEENKEKENEEEENEEEENQEEENEEEENEEEENEEEENQEEDNKEEDNEGEENQEEEEHENRGNELLEQENRGKIMKRSPYETRFGGKKN